MEGTQIGQYVIERQLGQGGFGVVYVGIDVRLGRRAAIKQLLPELSSHHDIVERFFNEAKAAANINHPGIVEIYDVGWHTDGSAYFAMKLLDGDSLAKRLRTTGPMTVQLAATIARQVSSALAAAHARGIVHRDLKPDNVVLVSDDEVAIGERATVLDFGIAKLFGDKPASQKTRTGMMMGTPSYMSPEQCRGAGEVDHRTDIYALGCMMFEMLTGRPPFVGEGAGEILGMHQFVEPPTVRSLRPDVPVELEAVIARALAKKPDQRMQQMTELTTALQPFAAAGGRSMEHAAQRPSVSQPIPQTPVASAQPITPEPSTFSSAGGELAAAPVAKPRRLGLVLGLAGLVAVAAIVVVVMASSSGSRPAAPPGGGSELAANDRAGIDAASALVAAPDAAAVEPDAAIAAGAPADARVAVTVDPDEANVRAFRDALGAGDLDKAKQALGKITSPLLLLDAKAGYAKALAAAADALVAELAPLKSDCKAFDARLQRSGRAVADVARTRSRCKAAAPAGCSPACASGEVCKASACVKLPVPAAACDPTAVAEAETKGDRHNSEGAWAAALAAYESQLKCKPGMVLKVYLSACKARKAAKAKAYFNMLPEGRRDSLSQLCLKEGIDPRL